MAANFNMSIGSTLDVTVKCNFKVDLVNLPSVEGEDQMDTVLDNIRDTTGYDLSLVRLDLSPDGTAENILLRYSDNCPASRPVYSTVDAPTPRALIAAILRLPGTLGLRIMMTMASECDWIDLE